MVYFSRKHVLGNHRSQILFKDDCVAKFKDFSGGPVVTTLLFPCRGSGFDPW